MLGLDPDGGLDAVADGTGQIGQADREFLRCVDDLSVAQGERGAPAIPPGVTDAPAVEDKVLSFRMLQMPTDREPRLPAADDNRIDHSVHGRCTSVGRSIGSGA